MNFPVDRPKSHLRFDNLRSEGRLIRLIAKDFLNDFLLGHGMTMEGKNSLDACRPTPVGELLLSGG